MSIAAVQRLERLILLHTGTVLQDLAHSLECLTLGGQLLEEPLPTQGDTPWRILNIGRNEAPAMAAAASFLGGHLQPAEEGGEEERSKSSVRAVSRLSLLAMGVTCSAREGRKWMEEWEVSARNQELGNSKRRGMEAKRAERDDNNMNGLGK